jgi:alpha-glucoside transport system substrate-binding protein
MKKSKWFAGALLLIAALLMAALLAACSPAAEPTDEVETEEPEVEVTDEPEVEETDEATAEVTEEATDEATEEATEVASGDIDCMGAADGDEVTMLYQWSGVEEEQLMEILQPLVDACGIVFTPEATRDQAILETRIASGTPPDLVFWNLTQIEQYQDSLVPVTELGVHEENYADYWRELGTFNDEWLGLPVKADIKTIIWYNPAVFEAYGYEVPETWEELDALVEQMKEDGAADGIVPWSMGIESGDATGWTASDFIQDILLVTQGPEYVNGIISGEIPYNDPGVAEAYEIYGRWASDPAYAAGGAEGTLSTPFADAIFLPFSDPPEAFMVKQSGFAGANIKDQFPDLEYGVDYDFFGVPGAQGVQGGSDWLMAFSDEPAVMATIAYLSSEAGGQKWAEVGFALTPNSAGETSYEDATLQKFADILAAASGFTADIGDSIPGGFSNAEWAAIVEYLNGGDLEELLQQAADVQAEALGD